MTKILLITMLCLASVTAQAANKHSGYLKKRGTYVAPHYQTAPDGKKYNNYSSKPNINPYSDKKGTIDPYAPKK